MEFSELHALLQRAARSTVVPTPVIEATFFGFSKNVRRVNTLHDPPVGGTIAGDVSLNIVAAVEGVYEVVFTVQLVGGVGRRWSFTVRDEGDASLLRLELVSTTAMQLVAFRTFLERDQDVNIANEEALADADIHLLNLLLVPLAT